MCRPRLLLACAIMEQLSTEIDRESRKADAKQGKHKVTIRWHDAGDFFSDKYLEMAYKLAATHPTVDFYAYTKNKLKLNNTPC